MKRVLGVVALLGLVGVENVAGANVDKSPITLTLHGVDDRLPPSPMPGGWIVTDIRPVKLNVLVNQDGYVTLVIKSGWGRRLLPPNRTSMKVKAGQVMTLLTPADQLTYGANEIQGYLSDRPLTIKQSENLKPDTSMTIYKEKMPLSPPKVDRLPPPPNP